ncbi:glycosyltransferase family 4 protein [Deinococcus aquaticus]|uniref:glycosyltransferase family 4 protein n=1 Tax=Deinococcus aquaticus TaxID=328692 RepID=UPI003F44DA9E
MNKLKILHVGPSKDVIGGINTVMSVLEEFGESRQLEFIRAPTYNSSLDIKSALMYLNSVMKAFTNTYDIAHIHLSQRGSIIRKLLYMSALKLAKKPYIVHMHGSEFKLHHSKMNKISKKLINTLINGSAKVICLSESWQVYYASIGIKNTVVINNPTPFKKISHSNISKSEVFQVIFVGEVGRRKGIYDLIDAIKLIKDTRQDLRLIVIGGGEIEHASTYSLENDCKDIISFVGWQGRDFVLKEVMKSQVLCLPSYNEGLPMVILEAFSLGTAVVSTNVGGIPEVIKEGVTGFICSPGDSNKISHDIIKLMDDNIRGPIVKNAFDEIDKYSPVVFVDKVKEIYLEVIK